VIYKTIIKKRIGKKLLQVSNQGVDGKNRNTEDAFLDSIFLKIYYPKSVTEIKNII